MRAAIYTRLSFVRGEDAPGIDRQEADCRRMAEARGWDVTEVYREPDVSAYRDVPRPEFERMRASLPDLDVVLVWKMDRGFRRIKEAVDFLEECRANGVAFVSVTEGVDTTGPYGELLFTLFISLAQIESRTKSDRITRWHRQRAERGLPVGGGRRAFGFARDGTTIDEREATSIREAVSGLLNGGTLTGTARRWNGAAVTTPTGGRWSKTSLRRMLLSPRIAGMREHQGATFPATWPAIVTQDEHLRLQARYSAPGRAVGRRYLLAGIARCGVCGGKLIARPKADGRRCYVCAADGCGKIRILAAQVEELVASRVNGRYEDEAVSRARAGEPEPKSDVDAIRRQLQADERALEDLARDRYVTRSITDAEFRAARDELVQRVADGQEVLARQAQRTWSDLMQLDLQAPWELPPGTDPDPDDFAYWRRWIGDVVEAVTIAPAVRGRNTFDPARVEIAWRESP